MVSVGDWIQIPDGPKIPPWLTDPSKIEGKVIGWVVEWLVDGLWNGVVEVVGWILDLFDEAIIKPSTAAGRSVVDAAGGVGDSVLLVVRALVDALQGLASSSPLAPIILGVLAAFVLVGLAYLARATVETFKLVTWK